MSNTFNHIQETETIQSFSQQPKKYWQYVYELRHIPTGLLYVGSRSNQSVLKKFEDCYTDKYLGSSSLKEGPFSKKDTKANPQDYAKTVLKVFYDEDPKEATKYEQGSNGLIMTYWNLYGKDKVLNQHCILNDGSKVFSNAGQNPYANKTIEELEEISQKQSDGQKKRWEEITPEKKAEVSQKLSEAATKQWEDMSPEKREEIRKKQSDAWENKSEEEKEEINQKQSEAAIKNWDNKPEEEKEEISQKMSDAKKGEKNGAHTQYIHPYNHEFKGNCKKISTDIRKNYPNEIPWKQIPRKKRNELKIQKID